MASDRAILAPDRPGAPSAQLKVYQRPSGDYFAVVVLRTLRHGTFCLRVELARVADDFEPEAVSGAIEYALARRSPLHGRRLTRKSEFGADESSPIATMAAKAAHPILDAVAAVLNNPLTALAAAATVMIPGVGPAYLVSYAIGQALIDYGERKTRS